MFSVKLGPVVDRKVCLEYGSELITERKEDEDTKRTTASQSSVKI